MACYKWKRINELADKEEACVFARVIDKKENMLVLDDGTGKLTVFLETLRNKSAVEGIKAGDKVRVFGTAFRVAGELCMNADLIQRFNVDEETYKKILDLTNQVKRCLPRS